MLKFSYRLLVVLLMLVFVVGCRQQVELIDAKAVKDTSLEPIDLVLKIVTVAWPQPINDPFAAPQSQIIPHDDALGVTVTRSVDTRTPEIDEVIKDLNIFLFHKERDSIVRHYYIVNANPALPIAEIHLDNLYVGNYDFYVIANNGKSLCDDHTTEFGCTHRRADMNDMMSSVIPVNRTPYFNLMTYRNDNFTIKRDKQELAFELQRLTSAFEVELINNCADVYLLSYSIINIPVRTKLFSTYTPVWTDMGLLAKIPFGSDPTIEPFTMLNNLQGDVLASAIPSYKDRNGSNAPSDATCLRIYAEFTEADQPRQISYLIYVGGPGGVYNNYDVLPEQKYRLNVTFNRPNFVDNPDPRITSFTVLDENSPFTNGTPTNRFTVGTVISRPLTVEYSKVFANDSLFLTCMQQSIPSSQTFQYSVYAVGEFVETLLYQGPIAEPIVRLYIPTSKEVTGMDRANLRITYTQTDVTKSILLLLLETANGQDYVITPQTINYIR